MSCSVDAPAIVVEAVCNEKDRRSGYGIIARNLLENILPESDCWSLALGNEAWPLITSIGHDVRSTRSTSCGDDRLQLEESDRISEMLDQGPYQVLTYPFFRRQPDKFPADAIQNDVSVGIGMRLKR